VSDSRPIGIFDSGIGGLTVLAALRARFPSESFVYLGDTARLPYGTKSVQTVARYSLRAALYLLEHGIKALVVACNTASSTALPVVEHAVTVPVVGVVVPGATAALAAHGRRIGVIGTEATVASGAYPRALHALDPAVEVVAHPCPLFVPLAEEGWFDHPVTREVAEIYLAPFREAVDVLILGCTHYPPLKPAIAAAVGSKVRLVDSALALADALAELLADGRIAAGESGGGVRLLVTDAASRFSHIAHLLLPNVDASLELVDLPSYVAP
jgi:glutamate racemase